MTVKRDSSTMGEVSTCSTCQKCNEVFQSRNALFRHLNGVRCDASPVNEASQQITTSCVATMPTTTLSSSCDTTSSIANIQERFLACGESSVKKSSVAVVVAGGRLRGRTLQSCERYDVFRSTWESFPSMLENRGSHGAAVINNTFYVVGGGGLSTNLSSCEKIVQEDGSNMWEYIAPMNPKSPRHALSVLTHDNKIYAIGGWYHGSTCSSDMEIYDPQTNAWSKGPSLQVPRRLLATTAWKNGIILAIGGCCADGDWNSSAVETFATASASDTSISWIRKLDAPCSGQASATTAHGDQVYVFFHCHSKVYEYNPECDAWKYIGALPIPDWSCFQIVTMGKRFIFCLGGASRGKWLNAFWVFDTVDNTWWELPPMQKQRRRPAAALLTTYL